MSPLESEHVGFGARLVCPEAYSLREIEAKGLSHRQPQETSSCGTGFSLDSLRNPRYAEGQPRLRCLSGFGQQPVEIGIGNTLKQASLSTPASYSIDHPPDCVPSW